MTLVVTGYGLHLSKEGNCIVAQGKDGKKQYYSVDGIDAVMLTEHCGLTTGVIQLCMEHDIPMVMQQSDGTPAWSVESFSGGSAPIIRRRQLGLQRSQTGLTLAKMLETGKLEHRAAFLRKLAWETSGAAREALLQAAGTLESYAGQIQALEGPHVLALRGTILGLEGSAGRCYFATLATRVPPELAFERRSTRGASDPFNMLLNYGYGVLYQRLRQACLAARMDPYIGILHADQYNRPTLTYDLIEPFRHLAERAALKVCQVGIREHPSDWMHYPGALTQPHRQALIQALLAELRRGIKRDGRQISWAEEITRTARTVANLIQTAPEEEQIWQTAI